jgi:transposase
MMARFVAAYRKSSKNDGNDAEAICEAVARPNMRFVPVKSAEQQAILSLHRVRQGFIEQRTATINRIRGLLGEFGVVLPQRADQVRRAAIVVAEELPVLAREAIADLRAHLTYLDARISHYERQLISLAKQHEPARRIQGLCGVGPLTASAITASMASGHEFANGRQFAAWLGLVPRQYSTGGKDTPGPHHQARRWVFAHASHARCARRPAERRAKNGSAVTLGAGIARATWVSPRHHRRGGQERPHHLGAAGEQSRVRVTRIGHSI